MEQGFDFLDQCRGRGAAPIDAGQFDHGKGEGRAGRMAPGQDVEGALGEPLNVVHLRRRLDARGLGRASVGDGAGNTGRQLRQHNRAQPGATHYAVTGAQHDVDGVEALSGLQPRKCAGHMLGG